MKRLLVLFPIFLMATAVFAIGNGWIGYHKNNIFVGTCQQWCEQKFFDGQPADCTGYCGEAYVNDKLVMKWNDEWNRGNEEGWSEPPYDAWLDNEWNGNCKDCSGEVWHYKIKWVSNPENNEYPIWGQFAVIMSQGTDSTGHIWQTHEIPNGYGV